MSAIRPTRVTDLVDLAGSELGVTGWRTISQDDVDRFADLTGDHQWIHVDRERARRSTFEGTIAHGLLTLSLGPTLIEELMAFDGFAHGLNYGYDRVRFTAPVPVDSRVRMRAHVEGVEVVDAAATVTIRQEFELEHSPKPACVAWNLIRFAE